MIESRHQQDLDDFAALYVGHYEQLLRLAVLLVGDLAAAEDVVQEAFIRVHHRLGVHSVNCPLAYLRQSVVNLARSELRSRPDHSKCSKCALASSGDPAALDTASSRAASGHGLSASITASSSTAASNCQPRR
jgi:DNA-directed RNA polymerase specialized sigma24 family protein